MTRVLQFRCQPDPPSTQLKEVMVEQINLWAQLEPQKPGQVTLPLTVDIWSQHTTIEGLWWIDFDELYSKGVGDIGRKIADRLLGNGQLQGILKNAPLAQVVPGSNLELLDVADLVAAGYLPGNASTDDPPPFVPDPNFDPDLSIRTTEPEIPSVGWIFLEATGTALGQMDTAARDAGLADDQDQVHRCASNPSTGIPRWALKRHRLGPALLAIFGGPYWQVAAPAFSRGWATWPAGASR